MSVTITPSFDPTTALAKRDLEDGHGRKMQLQCSVLEFPDPEVYFQPLISDFEAQEAAISAYLASLQL